MKIVCRLITAWTGTKDTKIKVEKPFQIFNLFGSNSYAHN